MRDKIAAAFGLRNVEAYIVNEGKGEDGFSAAATSKEEKNVGKRQAAAQEEKNVGKRQAAAQSLRDQAGSLMKAAWEEVSIGRSSHPLCF